MTGGNAFFVQRFLLHLHQAGLLRWDPEQRHWAWDAAAIERAELTDDVLGLMLEAIRRLPAPHPAPAGDGGLLPAPRGSGAAGRRWSASRSTRWQASWWAPSRKACWCPTPMTARPLATGRGRAIRYRFVHDRVQQAAYSLLDQARRIQLHLAIGRLLLAQLPEATVDQGRAEALFEAVDQLRPAHALITDGAERARLARLYAEAGGRAQAASAYGPALAYLTAALELLPAGAEARAIPPGAGSSCTGRPCSWPT